MTTKANASALESFFAALADRTRLRLLNLMRGGEVCVCFFAETLETNNPKISRHLSYLKRAKLVAARRDGKWMHYRIEMPENGQIRGILEETLATFDQDAQMRADRKALDRICCSPAAPVAISRSAGAKSSRGRQPQTYKRRKKADKDT